MLHLFPAFADLPDKPAAEAWLQAHGETITLPEGHALMQEGDEVRYMTFVLSGEIDLMLMQQSDRRMHLQGILKAGDITGALPYSRLRKATGRATVREEATLYRLDRSQFPALITDQPAMTEALVHVLATRIRDFTRQDVQSEKLSALGRMAAGLAHELNNPAAALRSLAQELERRLASLIPTLAGLAGEDSRIGALLADMPSAGAPLTGLAKARSLRELEDWLDLDLSLPDAATVAGDLADLGFTRAQLEAAVQGLKPEDARALLGLQAQLLGMRHLADDVGEASARISRLVESIKDFTHMDQAQEAEPVSLAHSVQTTLRLLAHKAREAKVNVENHIPDDLPQALAHPGELGQVWTNLLDNAFYAAHRTASPPPLVTLRGSCTAEVVWVEVEDNGPGIAPEALPRIFEPFFTTKAVGEGTGLGLELARRILTKASGDIRVESTPGRTIFRVILPRADQAG